MALQDMKVYDTEIYTTTIEMLGQKLEAFNASSGGAIVLDTNAWRGNYTAQSFFSQLAGAQRRVDRASANSTQAATSLEQSEVGGVKVAGGFGPVIFEPSQLTWLMESPDVAINVIAEGFADALLADQLNTVVGCAVAAISNVAAITNDESATSGLTQKALNNGHAKFQDMSGMLRTDVMTGNAYHKLIGNALDNGERLFDSSNVQVISILGKTIVVSDIPALYVSGTPNKSYVLSLVAGALIVDNSSDIITNMETSNGKGRIETTWQADYSFGVTLKGYKWDVANGGPSPTDAALFTGSNWEMVMADNKHQAGAVTIVDADI